MKHQRTPERTPPLTFGVLENITYALVGGIGTAIARSCCSRYARQTNI